MLSTSQTFAYAPTLFYFFQDKIVQTHLNIMKSKFFNWKIRIVVMAIKFELLLLDEINSYGK